MTKSWPFAVMGKGDSTDHGLTRVSLRRAHPLTRIQEALFVAAAFVMWAAPAPTIAAGDWEFDIEPGEWDIAMLEQPRDGHLEHEKLAVGCGRTGLFVQRYSPTGHTPTSVARFDGGAPVVIVWDKLDLPNTMWAHGTTAESLVDGLLRASMVSFQQNGRSEQVTVAFAVAGADRAIMPILGRCAHKVRPKPIVSRADGGITVTWDLLDPGSTGGEAPLGR
jgi:hypothetical protein